MIKKISAIGMTVLFTFLYFFTVYAGETAALPRVETPNYRVSFYHYDCFNMQDENGIRSGYGYEMMQGLAQYMQCTFSYVGYDKSAAECEEMLRDGELDVYTAAYRTPERETEFTFSKHPVVTATTCMNVKIDNTSVIAGDYSTYDGLTIGLLRRHTYNDKTLAYLEDKGIDCDIFYYETPAALTNALIKGEVDAIVNSYMGVPEDERTVESFGETPYYLMARKEDQALIDDFDAAFDLMNIENPTWRSNLYDTYYGTSTHNTDLNGEEQALLTQLQEEGVTIRAAASPDNAPYSSFEDGEAVGIIPDLFRATADALGLKYEILPADSREEYQELLNSGKVDIWMDMAGYYGDEENVKYKLSRDYLSTSVSMLCTRGNYGVVEKVAVMDDYSSIQSILTKNWPEAEIVRAGSTEECVRMVTSGEADAALLMTYTAQSLTRSDVQNRLQSYLIPGASIGLRMGVNADIDHTFYGIWEKTLAEVSEQQEDEIIQSYMEQSEERSLIGTLYDHPTLMLLLGCGGVMIVFLLFISLYVYRQNKKQKVISGRLEEALAQANEAIEAKQNFFSKMSHDIRTPLNVVLGMTQVAQKYKNDTAHLETALNNISSEGSYLLTLISSILDVNQLEHGKIELINEPFDLSRIFDSSELVLKPLAEKKEQQLTFECPEGAHIVVGDSGRYSQIIINIVSNAVKYTPAGGYIRVSMEYLPENICRFTCTDNGIGMDKEFIAHITEEYTRAEDSRVSKTQGTGLGMSVVKGFTDLMNGTLKIESEPGKGSTFIVDIPFPPATPEQAEKLRLMQEDDQVESYSGKRVLLAEDNALNAEIAIELLQTIGLTVDWAEDGKQAIERFEASKPGEYFAVFMDMQMPVMDGVEATKRIRASRHPDHTIPIFAMTANTFASDRKRCFDAGMTGYIAKPISLNEITTALQNEIEPEE